MSMWLSERRQGAGMCAATLYRLWTQFVSSIVQNPLYFSRNFAMLYCFVWTGWARVAENSKSFQCSPSPSRPWPRQSGLGVLSADQWEPSVAGIRVMCSNSHIAHCTHPASGERGDLNLKPFPPPLQIYRHSLWCVWKLERCDNKQNPISYRKINKLRPHLLKSLSVCLCRNVET